MMHDRESATRDHPKQYEFLLLPERVTLRAAAGETYLHALQEASVGIPAVCGGMGTCGQCGIRFVALAPDPSVADLRFLSQSEIQDGWRLACQHTVESEATIEWSPERGELDQKASQDVLVSGEAADPGLRERIVEMPLARPGRRPARTAHLQESLPDQEQLDLSALRRLSLLAPGKRSVSVVSSGERIVDVRDIETPSSLCGIAVDVGTTTLAVFLFDLVSGRQLGAAAARNPQRKYGADVISRIAHVRQEGPRGLDALHAAVTAGLNGLVRQLARAATIPADSIYKATIVGNPTMIHLLLRVSPVGIDVSPYVPAFTDSVGCLAESIGLAIHPGAIVETLPAVSAYVGADTVAGVLATELGEPDGRRLLLDVGTNGELVLAANGRLIACSTAAGPAFEGASIVQGMNALHGAIESVHVTPDGGVSCRVIGDESPIGICGSGLLSAVAELRRAGVIDASGRLSSSSSGPLASRSEGRGKDARFRLTDGDSPVFLYQSDVREFQLAKAALRAGIESLLAHSGLPAAHLDRILLGGAFSSGVRAQDLLLTGLLPAVAEDRVELVGNVAGRGAKIVLLDQQRMDACRALVDRVEYLELSGDSAFTELYVANMHMEEKR